MLNLKKMFSALLGITMVANMALNLPAFADEALITTYNYDDYKIEYSVATSWENSETIIITITNTGDSTIENWMLAYDDFNGEINNIWNAKIAETDSGYEYVRNVGHNANIEPNQSINFGYTLENYTGIPDILVMTQERLEKSTESYDATLNIINEWDSTFQGEIVLTNNTDQPIEWWELTFDSNFTITEVTTSWAASVVDNGNYNYTFKGTYTGIIDANSSVSLGFIGVKNGVPEISNYSLTAVVADEELIETVVDCFTNCDVLDSDCDNLPDCIELKIGTDPFTYDTDGDSVSDGDEVKVYGTNPLNADTDNDGLEDDAEGYNGVFYLKYGAYFDPFDIDTDDNGVLDGNETIAQTVNKSISVDDGLITGVTVNLDINNNLENHLQIYSAEISDPLASNAVGLISEPIAVSLPNDESFEGEGNVELKLNPQVLNEVNTDNLLLLWHDVKSDHLYELETYYDASNYTVQASVPNLCSNLLLVDADAWHSIYKSSSVFDTSVYQIINDTGLTWAESKKYCEDLEGHLVTISSEEEQMYLLGLMTQYGTNYTYWLGYRYVDEYEGVEPYWESINGEGMPYTNWAPDEPNALTNESVAHMYNIVPQIALNLGAKRGQWNDTLDEQDFNLEYSYRNSGIICEYDSTVDLDADGISDAIETAGMITKNGKVIYTDPDNPDTDGDGLLDGEEMIMNCKTDKRIAYLNPGQEYLFDDPTDYTVMDNQKLKGEISFVYFEYNSDPTIADVAESSELAISDVTVIPDITEGKAVSISGLITSNYDITSVKVDVYSAESGKVYTSSSAMPNKTSYNISVLDNDILFNKLPGGNTYYFRVIAEDSSGNILTLVNQNFNVLALSTLKIDNVTTIPDITQGTAVPISGLITSDYNITSVLVGVYSTEDGNSAYTYKEATPNSMSFNISAVDNYIEFNKVLGEPEGAIRYFRVVAADESGNVKTLVNQAFIVTGNSNSEIDSILSNIRNSATINSYGAEKVESCVATAKAMLESGYEPAFVVGMLGNVCCEGNVGQFEYYTSIDYMQYMQSNYNYSTNYSGKYIYNYNFNTVYNMVSEIKKKVTVINGAWYINGSRVGFGLGSIQWTFDRMYNLVNVYKEVNGGSSAINKAQVIEAEGMMILRELSGYYNNDFAYVYSNWVGSHTNLNSQDATYDAAYSLCVNYERPVNKYTKAVERGNVAESIYNEVMN